MFTDKLKLLEEIFGDYRQQRDEYLFWCPSCKHHKPKLSVNIDKNVFKCWVCEYAAKSIHFLVRRFGTRAQYGDWCELSGHLDFSEWGEEKRETPRVELPKEFMTLTGAPTKISASPRRYLKERGITQDDIIWWKMGYCTHGEYAGRIIVPSFDMNGRVNYFIARNYQTKWHAYKNPPSSKDLIFNELYVDWTKEICLVEGIFDAFKADNAVPLIGSTLRETSLLFKKIVENDPPCVYVALDPDARKREDKIIKLLMQYGIKVKKINVRPYKDVGEMTKEEFQKRKKEAKRLNRDVQLERLLERI